MIKVWPQFWSKPVKTCHKFYTALISGEKEFMPKSVYIFIKLKLRYIAVTINVNPENLTPLLEVMEVTIRTSGPVCPSTTSRTIKFSVSGNEEKKIC